VGTSVAVIGLGNMGSALAAKLLETSDRVHVWNRTAARAAPLTARGATLAKVPEAAMEAAEIIVCCVSNYDDCLGALAGCRDLAGKTLIQLTTGTPAEAGRFKAWAEQRRAHYLDGVILAFPGEIGGPQTMIAVAGSEAGWRIAASTIMSLGGASLYLGEDLSAPIALETALITPGLLALIGMIHGAAVLERSGFDMKRYAAIVAASGGQMAASLGRQARAIANGNFSDTEASLATWAAGIEHNAGIFGYRDADLDPLKPVRALLRAAVAAGYGDEEIAAAIKILRDQQR